MSDWADLDAELSLWRAQGMTPTFWVRDDDVQRPTADLDRLIALCDRADAPLHLAAIPKGLDAGLAPHVNGHPDVWVLQHGFAHINCAPKSERASEFGPSRSLDEITHDLVTGWDILSSSGFDRLLPVFVPPWNRVRDHFVDLLAGLGYQLFSFSDPRETQFPVDGLQQFNIHVDPIRWKEGAKFRGEAKTLWNTIEHLVQRRTQEVDPDEPTGINTHHLQTDAETWAFMERLFPHLTDRGVRWIRLKDYL